MQTIIITGGAGFIGSNNEYANLEITKILLQSLWKSENIISFVPYQTGHDRRYGMDVSKIKNDLNWKRGVCFLTIQSILDFYW